jgi:hypothetical protein
MGGLGREAKRAIWKSATRLGQSVGVGSRVEPALNRRSVSIAEENHVLRTLLGSSLGRVFFDFQHFLTFQKSRNRRVGLLGVVSCWY